MNDGALRALEFDRVVSVTAGLAITDTGRDRLAELQPMTTAGPVIRALRATTEGVRFLTDHSEFPLRPPSNLHALIHALEVEGQALEPPTLLALGDYLESIERTGASVRKIGGGFPILDRLVDDIASFRPEIAELRRAVDPSGEVVDAASPTLASIRDRLRRQRSKLRTTLDAFVRGRDTAKYLQEHVVTERSGRFVLVVKAEHRSAVPGIVHGSSASGASLFLEPMATVEINNDIVALEEQEAEEVHRILQALTDRFRERPEEVTRTLEVATELDVIQARARLSMIVDGIEPSISDDGTFELRGARHPMLIEAFRSREAWAESGSDRETTPAVAVPNDIVMLPPTHVIVVTGPNTGGKTVALKTAGLLAAMAQAGLHVPADVGSSLPVFRSLFADIGDEQSISASLSTFSAHVANVVSMCRELELPALVLLDEVGAGTDPVEGGALGIAVIDHFRSRGAHLIATTHYDVLKSYASTTPGVASAAFGFTPESFAPTYKLIYGGPGRSLAIEIAARLGMPPTVIAAARENLTEEQKQLADHLARMDSDLRAVESEQRELGLQRAALAERTRKLEAREEAVREREQVFRRRMENKLDDQVRTARRAIDAVIEDLRKQAPRLVNTGQTGAARSEARAAVDEIVGRVKHAVDEGSAPRDVRVPEDRGVVAPGSRVIVGQLGIEGVVVRVDGHDAEVDIHGKRLRAPLANLRVVEGAAPTARVSVHVDLQPREGASLNELNVIGATVDEALARLEKFLDESTLTDQRTIRIVHGHGTGQLRRAIGAFLKTHPSVTDFRPAAQNQGGSGATVVELKE